jgi:O-methyltransferase involved in polyketide biosynthesis
MYLTHEAMRATLAGVAKRSAPGSTLIINYHTIQRSFFAKIIFRLIGEPMISHWLPADMAAALRSAGFEVVEDSGLPDWVKRYATDPTAGRRGFFMRIAVARKV